MLTPDEQRAVDAWKAAGNEVCVYPLGFRSLTVENDPYGIRVRLDYRRAPYMRPGANPASVPHIPEPFPSTRAQVAS